VTYITRYYDEAGLQAELDKLTTSVRNRDMKHPAVFELQQNYPNPFNPSTTIKYKINQTSRVELIITDMLGQKIKTLINATQTVGAYQTEWRGKNQKGEIMPGGMYIYTLKAGLYSVSKRMLFIK